MGLYQVKGGNPSMFISYLTLSRHGYLTVGSTFMVVSALCVKAKIHFHESSVGQNY
jgi:hypothetical protein